MLLYFDIALALGGAALIGFLSHWLYFIRGEHHLHAMFYSQLGTTVFITILCLQMQFYLSTFVQAFINTVFVASAFSTALFSSIVTYRVFFHPLSRFPGPKAMAITKLAHILKSRGLDNHSQMDRLHRQYGDFVRTGPSELTVFMPEAYHALHGPLSKCTKSDWYDVLKPNNSMHSTRIKDIHTKQKRIWDYAFGSRAIAEYEPRILKHTANLRQCISDREGEPVNMTETIFFFAADVVGDLVSSTDFNMIQCGKKHFAAETLSAGFKPVGYLNPVPWLLIFLMAVPGVMSPWFRVIEWSRQEVQRRLKVLAWLIDPSRKTKRAKKEISSLADDSVLAVLAGSGTITPALTFITYRLALAPSHMLKIRAELESVKSIQSNQDLQALPHLNAFIYESMRVHPPILDGLPRNTPAEGIMIKGRFIPGGVTCIAPFCTISKLESCFEDAESFIPERWTTAPHLIKNRDAHMPFSTGPFSCVGKNLALMVLRLVVATLVSEFDMEFVPGEVKSTVVDQSYNTVTNNPGPLRLVFKRRSTSKDYTVS